MKKAIGIIAEDKSDVEVARALISKIIGDDFFIEHFLGHGCGRIKSKCKPWAQSLKEKGCKYLILIHDLDDNEICALKNKIEASLSPSPIRKYLISIPVREIEAWLLSDEEAIRITFSITTKLRRIQNPESLDNPKEYIKFLVSKKSGRKSIYLNTIHNQKIAMISEIKSLRRCGSFKIFEDFVKNSIGS